MELVSEGAATPEYEVPPIFTDRRVLAAGFVAACVIAGYLVVAADEVGWLAISASVIASAVFFLVLVIDLRRALLFAFMFSMVQPLFTRMIFRLDFPDAGVLSMVGYKDPLTTTASLILMVAAGVACIQCLFSPEFRLSKRLVGCVSFYVILNAVQVFNPNTPVVAGIYGFKNNVLPVLMIFAGIMAVRTEDQLISFIKMVTTFSICALIYGLYQDIVGLPSFDNYWMSRTVSPYNSSFLYMMGNAETWDPSMASSVDIRVPSFFLGYTFYSYVITALGLVVYAAGKDFSEGMWKNVRRTCLLLLAAYYVVSMERTAIIMFVIGVIAIRLTLVKNKMRAVAFLIAVCVLLIPSYFVLYKTANFIAEKGVITGSSKLVRIAEMANPFKANSVAGRTRHMWKTGIELVGEHPLTGFGAGSATASRGTQSGSLRVKPHDEFLHKEIELGVFGLAGFIALLYVTQRKLQRRAGDSNEPGRARKVAAGVFGALAAYVACALLNMPFIYEPGIVMWFLVGVAMYAATTVKDYELNENRN